MNKIINILFLLCSVLPLRAQDIHFSQFFEAPLSINPALTGYFKGQHRMSANAKSQWKTLGSPFQTYAFSYDMRMEKEKKRKDQKCLALGTNIFADKAGDLNLSTIQASVNLAYHLEVGYNQNLGAALSAGFGQKSISMGAAQWDDQYDPNVGGYNPGLSTAETNSFSPFFYPDFGVGLLYTLWRPEMNRTSNDAIKLVLGVGAFHVNAPDIKFYSDYSGAVLSPRITAHGLFETGVPFTNMYVVPSFFYSYQGGLQEIYIGSSVKYMLTEKSSYTRFRNQSFFSLGGYYRHKDAFIMFTQLELYDVALGLSYDFNISKLKAPPAVMNGFEVSLRYVISSSRYRAYF